MTTQVTRGSVSTSVFTLLDSELTKSLKGTEGFFQVDMTAERRPFAVITGLCALLNPFWRSPDRF